MKRTTYTTRNARYIVEEREDGNVVKRESDVHMLGLPCEEGFVEGTVQRLPYGGLLVLTEAGPIRTSLLVEVVVEEVAK